MKSATIDFEIITPCFCAGADQAKAEIRPASIRGELRWWFRVLGGTPEQEKAVFGGVGGRPAASRVTVRTKLLERLPAGPLPQKQAEPNYYLFHFAKASQDGARYQSNGHFAPGTRFRVHFGTRWSKDSDGDEWGVWLETVRAFSRLGGLGMRLRRGLGAVWRMDEELTFAELRDWALGLRPKVDIRFACDAQGKPFFQDRASEALFVLESLLRRLRREMPAGRSDTNPTPLGRGGRNRQASALRLRPVRLKEGFLPACFYVRSVLGPICDKPIDLDNCTFFHPPPRKRRPADPGVPLCLMT